MTEKKKATKEGIEKIINAYQEFCNEHQIRLFDLEQMRSWHIQILYTINQAIETHEKILEPDEWVTHE